MMAKKLSANILCNIMGPMFGKKTPRIAFVSSPCWSRALSTSKPKINRSGDKGHPCLTDRLSANAGVGRPFSMTKDDAEAKPALRKLVNSPAMPDFSITFSKNGHYSLLKAFTMSSLSKTYSSPELAA